MQFLQSSFSLQYQQKCTFQRPGACFAFFVFTLCLFNEVGYGFTFPIKGMQAMI